MLVKEKKASFFFKEDKWNGYVNLYAKYPDFGIEDRLCLMEKEKIPYLYECIKNYMEIHKVERVSITKEYALPGLRILISRIKRSLKRYDR